MRRLRVRPSGPLRGEVRLPGDKSVSHRALLLAGLAEGTSRLSGLGDGADVAATRRALGQMGVGLEDRGDALHVTGVGLDGLRLPAGALDCGNSGTTMRLLAGLLAGQRFGTRLVGDASLSRRPMARVVRPLRARGAHVAGTRPDDPESDELVPPLSFAPLVEGERLTGLEHTLPVASAQVKSALLLSGLYADGPTVLTEPLMSRDHTERLLLSLGVPLQTLGPVVVLDPDDWPRRGWDAFEWHMPGDVSSAAFVLAAAAIVPGSDVRVRGVGTNPTRIGFLEALRWMGARLHLLPGGDAAGGEPIADLALRTPADGPRLRGTTTAGEHLVRMLDEVPALVAVGAASGGRTEVRDAAELRHKESDRLSALAGMLAGFGVECTDLGDGLRVEGRPGGLRAARVDPAGDHRIAMAAAVLGLVADGETIVAPSDCVATSFPGFAEALRGLGADVAEEEVPG